MAGENRWGTVSGASSPDVLGNRVGIWARRHKPESLKCYRVVREGDLLADFEPGPRAPQEIGEFASNIAECEGQPVTIEIHAIVTNAEGVDRTGQVMHLRAVPAPSLAVGVGSDAALAVVLTGYQALQKSTNEMLGSVTALVTQQSDTIRKLLDDSARRETELRTENDKLHELARAALDSARDTAAGVGEGRKTTTQKVEDILFPILQDAGRKIVGRAIGVDLDEDEDEAKPVKEPETVTGPVVNGAYQSEA